MQAKPPHTEQITALGQLTYDSTSTNELLYLKTSFVSISQLSKLGISYEELILVYSSDATIALLCDSLATRQKCQL